MKFADDESGGGLAAQCNDSRQDALEFEHRIGVQIYKLGRLIFLMLFEIPWLQMIQHNTITL